MSAIGWLIVGAVAVSPVVSTEALAQFAQEERPVTAADLIGKKFCWTNGNWDRFEANGDNFSGRGAGRGNHRKWAIAEPGVIEIIKPNRTKYWQTRVTPEGKLHIYSYVLLATEHDQDSWGTLCP